MVFAHILQDLTPLPPPLMVFPLSPLSPCREHPVGGPAGSVAARAGVHAAGLPGRGPRRAQRPEGDLPGEGAAAPPGAAGVPAAPRRLEGQVHVPDQL